MKASPETALYQFGLRKARTRRSFFTFIITEQSKANKQQQYFDQFRVHFVSFKKAASSPKRRYFFINKFI